MCVAYWSKCEAVPTHSLRSSSFRLALTSVFSLPSFFLSGWSASFRETPALIGWKDITLVLDRRWAKDASSPYVGEEPKAPHLWVCLHRLLLVLPSIGWASGPSHRIAPFNLARRGMGAGLSGISLTVHYQGRSFELGWIGAGDVLHNREVGELGSCKGLERSRGTLSHF